jgi:hypothetical protein
VRESFEDQRDSMLDDKAYWDQKRESQLRRRDRMEKRRVAPETNQKRYAEDYYYADTVDFDRYRMSNDPFAGDYQNQRNRMRPSEDEEEMLARKLERKKHKKREKERDEAQRRDEDRQRIQEDEKRRRQEDIEKAIADNKDEERKAEEERIKLKEEKRRRREEKKKLQAENEARELEEQNRLFKQAEK